MREEITGEWKMLHNEGFHNCMGASHSEASTTQSALTTAAPTPIGPHAA
jgi:hypothetical protein